MPADLYGSFSYLRKSLLKWNVVSSPGIIQLRIRGFGWANWGSLHLGGRGVPVSGMWLWNLRYFIKIQRKLLPYPADIYVSFSYLRKSLTWNVGYKPWVYTTVLGVMGRRITGGHLHPRRELTSDMKERPLRNELTILD